LTKKSRANLEVGGILSHPRTMETGGIIPCTRTNQRGDDPGNQELQRGDPH
jgi:hypothetical protein